MLSKKHAVIKNNSTTYVLSLLFGGDLLVVVNVLLLIKDAITWSNPLTHLGLLATGLLMMISLETGQNKNQVK